MPESGALNGRDSVYGTVTFVAEYGAYCGYFNMDYSWPGRGSHRQIRDAGNDPGDLIVTIIVGIAGAVIGGFIASAIGFGAVSGFNIRSIIIAAIAAFALLFALRMLKRG